MHSVFISSLHAANARFVKAFALTIALSPVVLASPAALAAGETVIESFGSTRLVQVGNNYLFLPRRQAAQARSSNTAARRSRPDSLPWSYIGGGENGERLSSRTSCRRHGSIYDLEHRQQRQRRFQRRGRCRCSGSSSVIRSLESSFQQDLNGDGMIGSAPAPKTVIESFGSTSLVQAGNNYYFYPVGGSSGPQFKYGGSAVVVGQFPWSYLGAEKTASGYQVALRIAGTDQYTSLEHRQQRQCGIQRGGRCRSRVRAP